MTKLKIAVIGTVGLPSKYGGFETLAEYLSKYLNNKYDMTVYCSTKSYDLKKKRYNNVKLKYIPLKATGVQSIPYDIISIILSLKNFNVILVLGASGAIIFPFIHFFTNKLIIFNMAGLEWKRSKWNIFARWYLKFSEKIAVKFSDVVVTDNQGLYDYINYEYGIESKIIAYGGDQVSRKCLSNELSSKYPFLLKQYYCAVARIQPDNNIKIILQAFADMPDKSLVFIGNWKFSDYGSELKMLYTSFENIHLLDPIYDLNILDQIRSNCFVYIHGHSAGGTNPSLVEAMYLELPIIAYDVNFNRYTTRDRALYFLDNKELNKIVNNLDNEERNNCSNNMKKIANKSYTWKKIVSEYEKLFEIKGV